MKNLMFFAVLALAFNMQSCAQRSDSEKVPEKVLSAFKANITSRSQKSGMENESKWEAEFKMIRKFNNEKGN